jgi:predicted TIM-barrel enzyme
MRFSDRPVVLPVIHVASAEQALRNARIARDAGADGVFLINHRIAAPELLDAYRHVAAAHPDLWIGVNCLGVAARDVFRTLPDGVAGVWVDDAGIREGVDDQVEAEQTALARRRASAQPSYFGGAAFKYQRGVTDLEAVARIAARYVDVVTTSGPGTGEAPDVEKIRRMRRALPATPLAIASGITPENVDAYLPWADAFLVATGISRTFEELDPPRVRALVERVRAYAGPRDHARALAASEQVDLEQVCGPWPPEADVIPLAGISPDHWPTLSADRFRAIAARASIWTHDSVVTLRFFGAHAPERSSAGDVLRAFGLDRTNVSVGRLTSARPVEDGFFACIYLVPATASARTVPAEAALRAFVRAEREAHADVENELRRRYGQPGVEQAAHLRFRQLDYPGFDTGTAELGFGLLLRHEGDDYRQPTRIWCWSRVVHLHK